MHLNQILFEIFIANCSEMWEDQTVQQLKLGPLYKVCLINMLFVDLSFYIHLHIEIE